VQAGCDHRLIGVIGVIAHSPAFPANELSLVSQHPHQAEKRLVDEETYSASKTNSMNETDPQNLFSHRCLPPSITKRDTIIYSLLNVRFGALLSPRGLRLIYM
jgi:hypothetical protein